MRENLGIEEEPRSLPPTLGDALLGRHRLLRRGVVWEQQKSILPGWRKYCLSGLLE
ncbi:MAG: hypothetical protein V7K31_25305 [Nostoc sp.]